MAQFKGKIHWYDGKKNYGFVVDGYGNEYFFHKSAIKRGRKIVTYGFEPEDEVEFDLEDDAEGGKKFATNISLTGDVQYNKPRNNNRRFNNNNRNNGGNTAMKSAMVKAGIVNEESSESAETTAVTDAE